MSRKPSVLIIGSGFGGIGAAIELTRSGFPDVTILEKSSDVGGVWRENTYPGAACDVPSPLYSYSYEPHVWPRRYSGGGEIHDYIRKTASKYGITPLIRFNTEVTEAEFDAGLGKWLVHTSAGDLIESDILISAVGVLSRPAFPDIPGIETFTGRSFHSAEWDHDYNLRGKRVAVIGTGASAAQFIPAIQPLVGELTVFQRTPPYVGPRFDAVFGRRHRLLRRYFPPLRYASRGFWFLLGETMTRGMIGSKLVAKSMTAAALGKLRLEVADPVLRAKLTPDYPIGCKRVLFSDDFLPALCAPNVEVVTDRIAEITPTGVRTADGTEREYDAIIYGTGFQVQDMLAPVKFRGLSGSDIRDAWPDGPHAYLGMAVPGFPNFFLMYGPNTNLGANSIVYMLEAQARYVRQAAELLAKAPTPSYLDVREDVERRYDEEIQRRLATVTWAMCSSWYRNDAGRVTTNWPGQVIEYYGRTKHLDPTDYTLTPVDASTT